MNSHSSNIESSPGPPQFHAGVPDASFPASSSPDENQFRTLAENLPQMVFTCDAGGRKNYCCQRYLEYTGCSSFEDIDRRWLSIIHPENQSAALHAWTQALENETPYLAEYRMRRYDGVYRHHLARAIPTFNSEGKVSGWVGTITDIHDQKLNDELLRRSEKLAVAGRMAAFLAHEINNPLASVTNAIFLALQDPTLSPATQKFLKIADRELSRVAQFTVHSLRFHKQSGAARRASLTDIMRSVIALYQDRLDALSIHLDVDYRTDAKLLCRIDDIRQAFSQLISNALDAMPSGGRLRLRIRLSQQWNQSQSPGIRVIVADKGEGIASDFLPMALDAFTTTKSAVRTGLGLWVVEEIARNHKGSVSIRSSTDPQRHGTVVSIFLPLLDSAS